MHGCLVTVPETGRLVVRRELSQKEELDIGVEFLRRRDFLKPSVRDEGDRSKLACTAAVVIDQLFAVHASYLGVSSS